MQPEKQTTPLWERPILRDTAGRTLRPGGFTLTDRALSLVGLKAGQRVLDVGCGLGATVEHLIDSHNLNACGIDNSESQLSEAPAHLPLTLADASCIPSQDSYFDAVICECVLSLMPDLPRTIKEFRRILKEHGKIIITDIYQRNPQTNFSVAGSCASSPLNISKLQAVLHENGLHVTAIEDHSKMLAELAARLIFAGEKGVWQSGSCCGRPGYMLLIAEKHSK